MKRYYVMMVFTCFILLSCAGQGAVKTEPVPGTVNLDAALGDFSGYIGGRLPSTTLTAVAITDVPVLRLGNYVADELASSLVNNTSLRMISRQDFERVLSEQNIQTAGNFDDDTTAKIGHNLGWQTIIFGTVEPTQEAYRLSLRAVDVESGELRGSKSYFLNGKDPTLISIVNPNMTIQHLSERNTMLEPFNGKLNNFALNITTNKEVYYDNEELFVTLRTNEDCYFVVYHLDIENKMSVIYPNLWEKDNNFLKAGETRTIPEKASFALHAPYGEERILVYASQRPFNIDEDQYDLKTITQDLISSPSATWRVDSESEISKGLSVVPRGATAQVSYTILPGR